MAIRPSGQWLAGIGLFPMTMRSGRELGSWRLRSHSYVRRVENGQGAERVWDLQNKKAALQGGATPLWIKDIYAAFHSSSALGP